MLSTLTNQRFGAVIGEDITCDDPWLSSEDLSGFVTDDNQDGKQYAACSYYRYFSTTQATEMKVGDTITWIAGFNQFENGAATARLNSGVSQELTWIISDFAVGMVSVVAAGIASLTLV